MQQTPSIIHFGIHIMKIRFPAVLAALALTLPVAAFAQQSTAGVTRAQVRHELVQIEKAGYNPSLRHETSYPTDIQAATAKLQANGPTAAEAAASEYGGSANAIAQSGPAAAPGALRSLYSRH